MAKQTAAQDLNDLYIAFAGEFTRNPCGRLWRVGYICICGVDHAEEEEKKRRARQH